MRIFLIIWCLALVNIAHAYQIYVSNFSTNNVSVIDTRTNTVTATIPVGLAPQFVVISPNGQFTYVANFSSNSVSVINTATNVVSATISVGVHPQFLAITPNGSTAYVSNNSDNTVSAIDLATNTVSATIPGIAILIL